MDELPLKMDSNFATVIVDEDGARVTLQQFLLNTEADCLFSELLENTPWKREHIQLYGRKVPIPRDTAWYGDHGAIYKYSGIVNEPNPWTESLCVLRDRVVLAVGAHVNSVLLNLYRNGKDSLSWHADDETELGALPIVASISLGATRRFSLRRRDSGGKPIHINLRHGSLLVMRGTTQQLYQHCVPKTAAEVEPRVNLTFRSVLPKGT